MALLKILCQQLIKIGINKLNIQCEQTFNIFKFNCYSVRSYDVTLWNGNIYGFFPDTCNTLWKTLQLNLSTNTWENLDIPLELDANSDVWLHSL